MLTPPRVRLVVPADLARAVELCVSGMLDNPMHVRVYGAEVGRRARRMRGFFKPVLSYVQRRGLLYGLYEAHPTDGYRLQGLFGLLPPGACRPSWSDRWHLSRVLVSGGSPAGMFRVLRWLFAWWRRDPPQPHWHLGPLVVAREVQGRGVGAHLVMAVVAETGVDFSKAWLETDKIENVRLYEHLGFEIVDHVAVMGVCNWFMRGEPEAERALGSPFKTPT